VHGDYSRALESVEIIKVTFLTIANSVNKMLSVLHGRKANSVKSPPEHQSVYKIVHSATWIVKIEDWQLFRKSSTVSTGEFTLSVFLVLKKQNVRRCILY
jgi:hypothetical protein